MPCNSFTSRSYTGRVMTTEMLMDSGSCDTDCPPVMSLPVGDDQPFDSESTGSSEDADLVPIHSGEDWVAQLDDDLSQPTAVAGDSFRISALQREDPNCITLHQWMLEKHFPPWTVTRDFRPDVSGVAVNVP